MGIPVILTPQSQEDLRGIVEYVPKDKTMAKAVHAPNLELSLAVKPLPLSKLEQIAGQYADTSDNKEAAKLEVQFLEGYYGKPVDQLHAKDTAV